MIDSNVAHSGALLDPDLAILCDCSNEQLKALVDILVFDTDGEKRYSESLSNTKAFAESYPNQLSNIIPAISDEIMRFGGNTLMNLMRGKGVPYRNILEDVCDRLKVNYNKKLSTPLLEGELLKKVAVTTIEKMSDEDIKKFDANLNKDRLIDAVMHNNGAMMAFSSIIVSQITRQAGGQVMMLFGRVLGARLVAFAGPFLAVIGGLWAINDIAGPAYRVTIPFTITLAFIRRSLTANSEELDTLFA